MRCVVLLILIGGLSVSVEPEIVHSLCSQPLRLQEEEAFLCATGLLELGREGMGWGANE